jgi:hypothetical protein
MRYQLSTIASTVKSGLYLHIPRARKDILIRHFRGLEQNTSLPSGKGLSTTQTYKHYHRKVSYML